MARFDFGFPIKKHTNPDSQQSMAKGPKTNTLPKASSLSFRVSVWNWEKITKAESARLAQGRTSPAVDSFCLIILTDYCEPPSAWTERRGLEQTRVPFPLTLALSLRERGNDRPPFGESRCGIGRMRCQKTSKATRLPLTHEPAPASGTPPGCENALGRSRGRCPRLSSGAPPARTFSGPEGQRNLAPGIARGGHALFWFCTPEGCWN